MSAAEHTILSADDYVQEMLRAAEAQHTVSALNRRAFLKLVGVAGGGLALAFYVGDRATAFATSVSDQGFARGEMCTYASEVVRRKRGWNHSILTDRQSQRRPCRG